MARTEIWAPCKPNLGKHVSYQISCLILDPEKQMRISSTVRPLRNTTSIITCHIAVVIFKLIIITKVITISYMCIANVQVPAVSVTSAHESSVCTDHTMRKSLKICYCLQENTSLFSYNLAQSKVQQLEKIKPGLTLNWTKETCFFWE